MTYAVALATLFTVMHVTGSPFVKPVRELLTGLELPHRMIFCARGSANRAKLSELTGKQFQVMLTFNTFIV
jgi:hypothetical protein